MRIALLLALVGCDAVYGLGDRPRSDAAPDVASPDDDALIEDAPPSGCRASGPPTFAGTPVFVFTNCNSFTTSAPANMALMSCSNVFYESPIATPGMVVAIVNREPDQLLSEPRLSPTGDEMFVTSTATVGGTRAIRAYRRTGGQWHLAAVPIGLPTAFAGANPLFASPPSMLVQGKRRIIIHQVAVMPKFSEFVEENESWTLVRDYTATELGTMTFAYPSLSPDGLHLVFSANPTGGGPVEVRYSQRESVNDPWDSSVKLDIGVDNATYPHLTADCARLYFTATTTLQYVDP